MGQRGIILAYRPAISTARSAMVSRARREKSRLIAAQCKHAGRLTVAESFLERDCQPATLTQNWSASGKDESPQYPVALTRRHAQAFGREVGGGHAPAGEFGRPGAPGNQCLGRRAHRGGGLKPVSALPRQPEKAFCAGRKARNRHAVVREGPQAGPAMADPPDGQRSIFLDLCGRERSENRQSAMRAPLASPHTPVIPVVRYVRMMPNAACSSAPDGIGIKPRATMGKFRGDDRRDLRP